MNQFEKWLTKHDGNHWYFALCNRLMMYDPRFRYRRWRIWRLEEKLFPDQYPKKRSAWTGRTRKT